MGYFKEVMMDYEEDFYYHIQKNGIVANGKYYVDSIKMQEDMPEAYFELLTDYVNGRLYG